MQQTLRSMAASGFSTLPASAADNIAPIHARVSVQFLFWNKH